MYEPWNSNEKLNPAIREIKIQYFPSKREDRLIKIPIIKHVTGADLQVISKYERNIYQQLNQSVKQDQISKSDDY